jgi:hypothetical protein
MRDKGCTRVLLKCSNEIDYREKLDLVVRLLHVSEQALRVATSTARDFVSQPETWSMLTQLIHRAILSVQRRRCTQKPHSCSSIILAATGHSFWHTFLERVQIQHQRE